MFKVDVIFINQISTKPYSIAKQSRDFQLSYIKWIIKDEVFFIKHNIETSFLSIEQGESNIFPKFFPKSW